MHFTGTTLVAAQGILSADALMRDHAGEAHLAAGASHLIFRFPRQTLLSHLSFINDGMQGEVRLLASSDGRQWTPLSGEVFTSADRQVSVSPGCAQARYLKLEFDSRQGGTLRCLRIQGGGSDLDYEVVQAAQGQPVNFAAGLGGGRMVYASAAGLGKERMVVYDFGQQRQLTEFASVHSRQPVGVKVYALSGLPEKEDWRGRLKADPAQVGQSGRLVAEAVDTFGSGHVRLRLAQPVTTRYLAMAWESHVDLGNFKTYEIAASGPGRILPATRSVVVSTEEVASSDRSTSASQAAEPRPVLTQVLYQPTVVPGMAIGSTSYAAGVAGGLGTGGAGKTRHGARRTSKAEEPPPEEEIPEFEGPAFGIDWCFAPSAS